MLARMSTLRREWLGLALIAAICASAPRAWACGVSGVDGAWSCSLEEHDEQERPRWQLGAAALYTSTQLVFGDVLRARQTRSAVVATLAYAPTPRLSLQANAGVAIGGELRTPEGAHAFSAGPTLAVGASYALLTEQPFFVAVSGMFAASFAQTTSPDADEEAVDYTALDLRLGLIGGVILLESLRPYAVARVFGGPVYWTYLGEARTGTDLYHYQLGAGISWQATEWLVLYAEGVPLGERAVSGGAALIL